MPSILSSIPKTSLGKNGPKVSAIGFGAMGISAFYQTPLSDEKAFEIFDKAIELGVTFWDTAHIYNNNEDVLGRYFKKSGNREKVFLATKWGVELSPFKIDGSAEYARESLELSLKRLGVDYVDLFYQHRIDENTPIEKSVAGVAELVKEGKVKHIGLSEVSAATLRRAHKVHPIAAVQIEYSPFALEAEKNGLIEAANELGVKIVAYSPLSRGFLTGQIKSRADFEPNDFRLVSPRFSEENFHKNLELVNELQKIADGVNATPGQVTLAWLISQGALPIPGTTKVARLEENAKGGLIELTAEEISEIRKFVDNAEVAGDRYASSANLYADTVELKE
ncbi:NADP-dependent oxidoreductase domain-containing protein [Lipomyces japonicus]|uniref:NADP-dependent oxidoreductase domain-containing protein n=1 Tax=Lipomyces japonicus TaxID=56871 RepID=UPI0034CE2691